MLSATTTQSSFAEQVYLMTQRDSLDALDTLAKIRERVTKEIGAIGSHMSRIGVAVNTLSTSRDSYIGAESRISDTDVASDAAELIKHQILQQAASQVLHSAILEP